MSRRIRPGDGYVAFLDCPENLELLVIAASKGTNETWTVDEAVFPGDLVVFYYQRPISAFVAYGHVVAPSSETWGDRDLPMAEIGGIQMLPRPVALARAKQESALPWLKAPAGFGRGMKTGIDRILALGATKKAQE